MAKFTLINQSQEKLFQSAGYLSSSRKSWWKKPGLYVNGNPAWVNVDDLRELENTSLKFQPKSGTHWGTLSIWSSWSILIALVEDLELWSTADYALKLGFEKNRWWPLKLCATIPYDEVSPQDLQKEVEDFSKIQNGWNFFGLSHAYGCA